MSASLCRGHGVEIQAHEALVAEVRIEAAVVLRIGAQGHRQLGQGAGDLELATTEAQLAIPLDLDHFVALGVLVMPPRMKPRSRVGTWA